MTSRTQSAFFFLIVFFFASGAGLLIYKNYNDYYQQKTAVDIESAQTSETPFITPKTATSTKQNLK